MTLPITFDEVVICFILMLFAGMLVDKFLEFRGL